MEKIKNLIKNQKEEINRRLDYADSIMSDKINNRIAQLDNLSFKEREKVEIVELDEYERLLNMNDEDKKTIVYDFIAEIDDIDEKKLVKFLVSKNYIYSRDYEKDRISTFYKDNYESLNNLALAKPPFTFISIIPEYNYVKNQVIRYVYISVSDEVAEELEEYCNKLRENNSDNEDTTIPAFIYNLVDQQYDESEKRCDYADEVINGKLNRKIRQMEIMSIEEREKFSKTLEIDKYAELLNPKGEDKFTYLTDVVAKNSDIPHKELLIYLKSNKYMYYYPFTEESFLEIAKEPFSYFALIPRYDKKTNVVKVTWEISLSDEVAKEVNDYCEKIRSGKIRKLFF